MLATRTDTQAAVLAAVQATVPHAQPETILGFQTPRDRRTGTHLEQVRDSLRAWKELEEPIDYERQVSNARILVGPTGSPTMQFAYTTDKGELMWGEPMPMSRRAARQLASRVLPNRGLGFLDRLVKDSSNPEADAKMAGIMWQRFMMRTGEAALWRTVKRGDQRVVRAALSQTYQVYDNLQFVEDTLRALGPRADLFQVVDWRLDAAALRVRMVGGSPDALEQWEAREVNKPFPMVSLWNGEVGESAVYVKAGTFTLWCSNGCGTWGAGAGKWRWNHSGSTGDRIRDGVAGAMEDAVLHAGGIVEAYEAATTTAIDDAYAWFVEQVGNDQPQRIHEAVGDALRNEATINGQGRLLASVVDAVTYVAHEQADIFQQDRLEHLAGTLLNRGLQQAENGRVRVEVA